MGYASFICPECDAHTRFSCRIYDGKLIFPKKSRNYKSTKINCSGCGKCFWKRNFIMIKKGVYTVDKIIKFKHKKIIIKTIKMTKEEEITKEELLKKMFRPVNL